MTEASLSKSTASACEASEGYDAAVSLLHKCVSENGFLASVSHKDNYNRVWSRDGAVTSLAALLTQDAKLINCAQRTLDTLAEHQGPHGEIPSNVDVSAGRISYGGTAGRVDADLWFVIACCEYWQRTGDDAFIDRMAQPLERVRFLLGAWEFNARGLLYIPPTGDWADEYLQSGYVLYDQLLYLQAQRALCSAYRRINQKVLPELQERSARLYCLIKANYWFAGDGETPENVYHEVLYEHGRKAFPHCRGNYWLPFFSPFGYGYRFDAFANVLANLLDVADENQTEDVNAYIEENVLDPEIKLLAAFHPVITPRDESWDDLQMSFSYSFKNAPYEYHNGGLWPLVSGFYAASLRKHGLLDKANSLTAAIHTANNRSNNGVEWSFPEFVHGKTYEPAGTQFMAWSAAAAIIAEKAWNETPLFSSE